MRYNGFKNSWGKKNHRIVYRSRYLKSPSKQSNYSHNPDHNSLREGTRFIIGALWIIFVIWLILEIGRMVGL